MMHKTVELTLPEGEMVNAVAPLIISASRATDIPAFYAEWFFRRLAEGYAVWRNPFNGKDSYVAFDNTRFVVFWSKNPAPLIKHLPALQKRSIGCYIQFTLNDYENCGLEPLLPPLEYRIETFKRLVGMLGHGSVVWRFDPLVLTDGISIDSLIERISRIGDTLQGYTEKLVFSFADIDSYRKVGKNLTAAGVKYKEWDNESMRVFAEKLSALNAARWNYTLATCAESISIEEFGIEHNRCIDPGLICRLKPSLQPLLFHARTDKGQHKACGCIPSKDIGAYNTCPHGCLYCYANTSPQTGKANFCTHNPQKTSLI